MPDQCPVCERRRESDTDYCAFHNAALANLESAYSAWQNAFGDLQRAEYLLKVERLPETGQAVKDLIRHMRGKRVVP